MPQSEASEHNDPEFETLDELRARRKAREEQEARSERKDKVYAKAEKEKELLSNDSHGVKWGLELLGFDIRRNLRSDRIELCRTDRDRDDELDQELRHLSDSWEEEKFAGLEIKDKHKYDALVDRLRSRDWIPLVDDVEDKLLEIFEKEFKMLKKRRRPSIIGEEYEEVPFSVTPTRWARHLRNAANERREDPFLVWLQEISDQWDGNDNVETMLDATLQASGETIDPELVKWASRAPFVGAIQRALDPGAKIDEFPVLIGAQGCGKSGYVESLIPKRFRFDWFGDRLELDADGKQQAEAIKGRVIVEAAEMVGRSKADIERLKAFLSRRDDGQHRGAYERHSKSQPRRCVFVGTANDHVNGVLPPDPTGLRRFVAVEVEGPPEDAELRKTAGNRMVEAIIDKIGIENLWAEAFMKVLSGEWGECGLPRRLRDAQQKANEGHAMVDTALEDAIMAADLPSTGLSLQQIASKIDMKGKSDGPLDKGSQWRLGDTLKRLGWQKKMDRYEDGGIKKRGNRWYPPEVV